MFNLLRPENSPMRTLRAGNARAESAPNEWTPTHTASLLKLALYAGVGVGVWLFLCSDAEGRAPEPDVEELSDGADDYSTWEPEQ
jgi:hypothetical protein